MSRWALGNNINSVNPMLTVSFQGGTAPAAAANVNMATFYSTWVRGVMSGVSGHVLSEMTDMIGYFTTKAGGAANAQNVRPLLTMDDALFSICRNLGDPHLRRANSWKHATPDNCQRQQSEPSHDSVLEQSSPQLGQPALDLPSACQSHERILWNPEQQAQGPHASLTRCGQHHIY